MIKLSRLAILATATLLALPPAAAPAQPGRPRPPTAPVQPMEYAVKIVCGVASGENRRFARMADGNYFTAVNVHNPGRTVRVSHKVTLAEILRLGDEDRPGRMTDILTDITLDYDEAIDFDCDWIRARLERAGVGVQAPGFFSGFLVLQTRTPLDVVAVYSAGADRVSTMHTERVPVRRVIP